MALNLALLYTYYLWDVANMHKNQHRASERGVIFTRSLFPTFAGLPKDYDVRRLQPVARALSPLIHSCPLTHSSPPTALPSHAQVLRLESGRTLLLHGYWGKARKFHYTMDAVMAFVWALATSSSGWYAWLLLASETASDGL